MTAYPLCNRSLAVLTACVVGLGSSVAHAQLCGIVESNTEFGVRELPDIRTEYECMPLFTGYTASPETRGSYCVPTDQRTVPRD